MWRSCALMHIGQLSKTIYVYQQMNGLSWALTLARSMHRRWTFRETHWTMVYSSRFYWKLCVKFALSYAMIKFVINSCAFHFWSIIMINDLRKRDGDKTCVRVFYETYISFGCFFRWFICLSLALTRHDGNHIQMRFECAIIVFSIIHSLVCGGEQRQQ